MIPSNTEMLINGIPIPFGSALGAFFTNDQGELQCGGYTYYSGETNHIALMGDDSITEEIDGFIDGQTIVWAIWDISLCDEYPISLIFSEQTSEFITNDILFVESIGHSCQLINLPSSWSMFSTYITLENMDLTSALGHLGDELIIVKDNNGNTYLPEYDFNGIGDLQVGQGYQLKLNSASNVEFCGELIEPEQNPIPLMSGWNLIAYLRLNSAPSDQVMENIVDNNNLIILKDHNGNPYLPEYNYNGLGDMAPGQGYQLKINEADTLNYLANNQEYRMLSNEVVNNKTNYYPELSPTGNNMHIVIPSYSWDIIPNEGSEIAVYSNDGLLVGTSKYTPPTTVVTIWGNDEFTIYNDGLSIEDPFTLSLLSDNIEYDMNITNWEKGSNNYQIDAINLIGSIERNSLINTSTLFNALPNPSSTKTVISFYIDTPSRVSINIYTILGELIYELTNAEYNRGLHELQMDVSNLDGGSYLFKMNAGEFAKTKQLIIVAD
jgi:hypothetical protein